MPSEARAKITCRLVDQQDPEKIFEAILAQGNKICPKGVDFSAHRLPNSGRPFRVPETTMRRRWQGRFLKKFMVPHLTLHDLEELSRDIHVLEELGVHTTMFGFSIDDENLHAPDEFFRLRNFYRGQAAYCRLFETLTV